jgi:endogenous inhibitor of DNA gyrase (YacG/DUF329 family)
VDYDERRIQASGVQLQRACEHCAASFMTRRSNRRFCSDRCRLRHWRRLQAAVSQPGDDPSEQLQTIEELRELLQRILARRASVVEKDHHRSLLAGLAQLQREMARLREENALMRQWIKQDLKCHRPDPDR